VLCSICSLYALEAFTGFFASAPFTAGSGKVVRVDVGD